MSEDECKGNPDTEQMELEQTNNTHTMEVALRTNKTRVSPCIHANSHLSASAHNVTSLALMKCPAVRDLRRAS